MGSPCGGPKSPFKDPPVSAGAACTAAAATSCLEQADNARADAQASTVNKPFITSFLSLLKLTTNFQKFVIKVLWRVRHDSDLDQVRTPIRGSTARTSRATKGRP